MITWAGHFLLINTGQKFVWIDTRGSDGLGHRFEMAVEHDAVVADQVAGHTGWIIQNQKVDTFQSHTIGDNGSFLAQTKLLKTSL